MSADLKTTRKWVTMHENAEKKSFSHEPTPKKRFSRPAGILYDFKLISRSAGNLPKIKNDDKDKKSEKEGKKEKGRDSEEKEKTKKNYAFGLFVR
ncbi:hypothetical protein TNIN_244541 [Trichonephila inaurata madagascariensis]|uniref:Uncharacterized protein n=1 Tax=Trichonephila inaurata madagascariensis TaxID=2747483 RepID=A0A8X7C0D1_9ARAC|nr:hypothetical protein TNIN_244541 [Trichonephila inaurata madagascariensis]